MNVNVLDQLSLFPPYIDVENSANTGNLLTVNQYGDVCLLTSDKSSPIIVSNTRSSGLPVVFPLTLNISWDTFLSYKFYNIEFNENGNVLLLWSNSYVGVISIPWQMTRSGHIEPPSANSDVCTFSIVAESYISKLRSRKTISIKQAKFHNISPNHVMILFNEGYILLVDLGRDATQLFELPKGVEFSSFCFGPNSSDWLKFTVFLLSDRDIYALCPIIPFGVQFSSNDNENMLSWFNEQCQSNPNEQYLRDVEDYISVVFTNLSLADQMKTQRKVEFSTQQVVLSTVTKLAECQGPIKLDQVRLKHSDDYLRKEAVDISCIRTKIGEASNAPIIVISFSDGTVDICLLQASEETPSSFMNPIWQGMSNWTKSITPSIIVAEHINLSSISDEIIERHPTGNKWHLISDPVKSNFITVFCPSTCKSYLISSSWLDDRVLGSDENDIIDAMKDKSVVTQILNGDEHSQLCAVNVIHDAFIGHIVIYGCVNKRKETEGSTLTFGHLSISAHLALQEFESAATISTFKIRHFNGVSESKGNIDDLKAFVDDRVIFKHIQRLKESLKKIPCPAIDSDVDMNEAQCVRDLSVANQFVAKELMLPFEEVGQRLVFRMEAIFETLKVQQIFLNGSAAPAGDGDAGLKSLIRSLGKTHKELTNRLSNIQETYEKQRLVLAKLKVYFSSRRKELSLLDKELRDDLLSWTQQLRHLNATIDKIRRQLLVSRFGADQSQAANESTSSEQTEKKAQSYIFSPLKTANAGFYSHQNVNTPNVSSFEGVSNVYPSSSSASPDILSKLGAISLSDAASPDSRDSRSPFTLSNLQPKIRSPYRPSLLHKSKTTPRQKS